MQPIGDGVAAEEALARFAGQTVYVHAESIPGGFLRNVRLLLRRGRVRGEGSCRVALQGEDTFVRMEDLQVWELETPERLVFLGYGEEDRRLRRTLEVSLTPLPEPLPDEAAQAPAAKTARGSGVSPAATPRPNRRDPSRAPLGPAAPAPATPTLLVALAHPDDETFICGGGLAAFAAAGGHVHLVCATRGEQGRRLGDPPYTSREGLPIEREAELREACRALGIEGLALLGLRDKCLEFEDEDALAARVALHIRRVRPQAVLTFHERRGGHSDHCTIGRAATLAWERAHDPAWHPEQLTGGVSAYHTPRLYFLAGGELARKPEAHGLVPAQFTAVPCAAVARAKMLAFRAHRTQTEMDRDLWDADEAKVVARFAKGVEYFQQAGAPFVAGEQGLLGLLPAAGTAERGAP